MIACFSGGEPTYTPQIKAGFSGLTMRPRVSDPPYNRDIIYMLES